ncbi:hypothetical protein HDU83_008568 [Entophlyctis luteolus]|nr:hypothetical protein HDU83_008568 [Entophlyctis luteolus]
MGQPQPALSPASAARTRLTNSGVPIAASVALVVATAASVRLLSPILVPFAWAVLVSVPLHSAKVSLAQDLMDSSILDLISEFLLGPLHSLITGRSRKVTVNPIVAAANAAATELWSVFLAKWAVRISLMQLMYTNRTVCAACVALAAGGLSYLSFFPPPTVRTPAQTYSAVRSAYSYASFFLILSLVIVPTIPAVYFTDNLISVSPELLHSGISFIAEPVPSHTPNARIPVRDLGVRRAILEFGVTEARNLLINYVDAELAISFPNRNVSCVEAAKLAMGGFQIYHDAMFNDKESGVAVIKKDLVVNGWGDSGYGAAAEHFRARFPQVVEFIQFAARGQRISALLAAGPAVAEIRWVGIDAFTFSVSTKSNQIFEDTVPKESLDPTTKLPAIVLPFLGDLAFGSFVFFSTVAVLVSSELGIVGYATQLFGDQLASAVLDPVSASLNLVFHILLFRLAFTHLISMLILPASSLPFQALLPFIATGVTIFPVISPVVALGIAPAIILFVVFNAPLAAAASLILQIFLTPEATILQAFMGTDGIGIIDSFAMWLGWMAAGTPGLVAGPWCFMAVGNIYRVLIGKLRG